MQLRDFEAQLTASGELGIRNRILFRSVASTNAVGKKIAARYQRNREPPPPTVLVAMEQTAGRGRLGSRWSSPPGGIYCSLVRPFDNGECLAILPMEVATRLCRELDAILDPPCRVKWPNDLMVQEKKVGGILIETVGSGAVLTAIVGFGINYSGVVPELASSATAVTQEAVGVPSMARLAARLIGVVENGLTGELSPSRVVEDYRRWSAHEVGQELRCRTLAGCSRGEFMGFDDRGFLRLRTAAGEELFSAGEIVEGEGSEHHES